MVLWSSLFLILVLDKTQVVNESGDFWLSTNRKPHLIAEHDPRLGKCTLSSLHQHLGKPCQNLDLATGPLSRQGNIWTGLVLVMKGLAALLSSSCELLGQNSGGELCTQRTATP